MPFLNSNDAYLEADGVDISPYWGESIAPKYTNDIQEVTGGSGATYRQNNEGLNSVDLDLKLGYDGTNIALYQHLIKQGEKRTITWGPLGNAAGMPKFSCPMIIKDVEVISQSVDKQKWMFAVSLTNDGAPTDRILDGDTF